MSRLSMFITGFLALIIGCVTDSPPENDQIEVSQAKIVYKITNGDTLNLHVFRPEGFEDTRLPVIVFFHGGGWKDGSPEQFFPFCLDLAREKMVAISAEYRLIDVHKTTAFDCVSDAKSVLRYLKTHAIALKIDSTSIISAGSSAGGHLAAAVAMIPHFNDNDDPPTVTSIPSSIIMFNPSLDNSQAGRGYDLVKEHWKSFSPFHNIQGNEPPMLILSGTNDQIIPISMLRQFRDSLTARGRECKLIEFEGQKHGFFNFEEGGNPYYNLSLSQIKSFIKEHKFIK